MNTFTLAAFSAEQRIGAVALFSGMQLVDIKLRHLPLDPKKASGSISSLVDRTFRDSKTKFIAISRPASKAGDRIHACCDAVKKIAAELGIPSVEIDDATLMAAYGHPPLTRKEHVRRVGRTIWPALNDARSRRAAVDAATAGLYIQTERLLSLHGVEA